LGPEGNAGPPGPSHLYDTPTIRSSSSTSTAAGLARSSTRTTEPCEAALRGPFWVSPRALAGGPRELCRRFLCFPGATHTVGCASSNFSLVHHGRNIRRSNIVACAAPAWPWPCPLRGYCTPNRGRGGIAGPADARSGGLAYTGCSIYPLNRHRASRDVAFWHKCDIDSATENVCCSPECVAKLFRASGRAILIQE
jgi:hypothetical protein